MQFLKASTGNPPTGDIVIAWKKRLAKYSSPDNKTALFELCITLFLFSLSWLGAYHFHGSVVFPVFVILSGFLIVRIFIIQHDCGHGSFFTSLRANQWLGRILGVVTMTPFSYWRHQHALHHASCGNLDKRGYGDVETRTVEEYEALSPRRQFFYRMYRNPWVMFGLGPAYLFLLRQRIPIGAMNKGIQPWISTIGTSLVILAVFSLLSYLLGPARFLTVQISIVVTGGTIGIWLFYVQHQFDPTHWDRTGKWNRETAALEGSSYYDLPAPLMWLTGYIGIHNAHHLASGIPFYKLPQAVAEFPELKSTNTLTLRSSLECVPLALWDEANRKLISFREHSQMRSAA